MSSHLLSQLAIAVALAGFATQGLSQTAGVPQGKEQVPVSANKPDTSQPATLQLKDLLPLPFSIAALVFSLVSYFQKKGERDQAFRKQMTDTLKELTELNLKDATFRGLKDKSTYPANYVGLLADQRRYLARQASSIFDEIPNLVNAHERVLIANAFQTVDYVEEAERFYNLAIHLTQSPVDKGLATRTYGRFLFDQARFGEGRMKYEAALSAFAGDDDRMRFYRNETLRRWAEQESRVCGDSSAAIKLLGQARDEARKMNIPARKKTEIDRIEAMALEIGAPLPVE
jgi:tetratricopeptide (TPR) repeat protein